MRLISCHIENFGILSNFDMDFSEGCNTVCRDNGSGKSTLAAFIRVMLYGFENERGRSELENERKRFAPWQGGIYGGRLTFEAGGKTYEAERTFGATKAKDTFTLRRAETNLISDDYTSDLGLELFGIDSASFQRTVFISQNDCATFATDAINAKLGDITEKTADIDGYNSAQETLKGLINGLNHNRNSAIPRLKEDIARLSETVRSENNLNRELAELTERHTELKNIQSGLRSRQELLHEKQRSADIAAKKKRYEELCADFEQRKAAMDIARSFFPAALPDRTELDRRIADSIELSGRLTLAEGSRLTSAEKDELQRLSEIFTEPLPRRDEIMSANNSLNKRHKLLLRAAELRLTDDEAAAFGNYKKRFGSAVPSDEEIDKMIETQNSLGAVNHTDVRSAAVLPMYALIGALLLAAGGVLAALGLPFGVIGIAAGVVLLMLAFIMPKLKKAPVTADLSAEARLRSFFEKYGMEYSAEKALPRLYALRSDAEKYRVLSGKYQRYEAEKPDTEAERLQNEVLAFIRRHLSGADSDDLSETLHRLERDSERLAALRKKAENSAEACSAADELAASIKAYIEALGFTAGADLHRQLIEVRDRLSAFIACSSEHDKAAAEKLAFETDEDMDAVLAAAAGSVDMEAVTDELSEIASQLNELQTSALPECERGQDELREKLDSVEAAKTELTEKNELLAAETSRCRLLEETRDMLAKARESLTSRYMNPIMEGFAKYYEIMSKREQRFSLDANIALTIDEAGRRRDLRFFSQGRQDLAGICLRMAMIDAMYKEEKPFVIFDDPFTNLDKESTEGGLDLLESIAKEYQAIYFTCHESRM